MNSNNWLSNLTGKNRNGPNQGQTTSRYTLEMESVPFDKFHFYLPKIPPSWRLPPAAKELYFRKTLEGVRAVQQASPDCHLRLMETRFPFQHLKQEVQRSLQDLYDSQLTMSTQHGTITMTNRTAFTLTRPKLLNAEGKLIQLPEPPTQITFSIRQRARFIHLMSPLMQWQPTQANPASAQKSRPFPWNEK